MPPDYLHFTKALGHVGLSQLPLQVLMAPASYIDTARPIAPSAVSVLTGLPQSTLTPYHRLVGRLVMAPLLVGHAVLYAFFFLQTPHPAFGTLLSKRIRDLDVQLGLAAAVATILVLLVARPTSQTRGFSFGGATVKTRRQVFYLVHVSLVMVLEAAAYFHVSHAQLFVLESFAASAINMVLMGVNRLG
ncbi:hypothetical protein ASPZODRAFT_131200 [Penicilliopsis zonata CBS 506.65]|uniref:Ferric oxidoreductase domain-containing protein n=1 Tax=Penicilliopsis zonata CBS 506.65 TaxID=1073090 RepID=A0A1L9SKB3_9EURO|nr:hypothetical protein ASPZODRAFT_131200 [Penicilliopsis zonata CBS 506.65]OJJ47648.1 hypothetical protein ASPZODRAFT_131200 [Penicilliopsis zonata CBS 506.65]